MTSDIEKDDVRTSFIQFRLRFLSRVKSLYLLLWLNWYILKMIHGSLIG
jgi:hypothetical protein